MKWQSFYTTLQPSNLLRDCRRTEHRYYNSKYKNIPYLYSAILCNSKVVWLLYESWRSISYNITLLGSVASIPDGIPIFLPDFRITTNCAMLKQRSKCALHLHYVTEEEIGADG